MTEQGVLLAFMGACFQGQLLSSEGLPWLKCNQVRSYVLITDEGAYELKSASI